MSRYHETLLRKHAEWSMHDKDKAYALPPLDAALAKLWLYHHWNGERHLDSLLMGVDQSRPSVVDPNGVLQEFVDQSLDGIDTMDVWSKRKTCPGCGESYKMENMVTCVDCHRTICWRCDAYQEAKGTCSCGGEMY